jgi:ABC-type lipoprotein release transport system permease subunit
MTKMILLPLALLLASATIAPAADQVSIDQQIQTIEHAPLKERFKLMNQFKMRLRHMNQEDRAQAIKALQNHTQLQHKPEQNVQNYQQNIQQTQQSMQVIQTNSQQNLSQQQAVRQWNSMGQPGKTLDGQNQTPMRIPMH